MKIKFLGHACFLITSGAGVKIITDPYATGGEIRYGEISESADIVTTSHDHYDHNNLSAVKGSPRIVREPARTEIKGVSIEGLQVYHDEYKGKNRGKNIIFCLGIDGLRVCHMGDLGHSLDANQVAALGKIDVLLLPVGGYYTIDAKTAKEVCGRLNPRVILPMHYRNEKCGLPIAPLDDFLAGEEDVSHTGSTEAEFQVGGLPAKAQIVVLEPAL